MAELHRAAPSVPASPLVTLLPPASRYILRGGADARASAERVLGVSIPVTACRAGGNAERAALWLGPDEWLLIGSEASGASLGAALAAALAGHAHSLVDVSHRQVALAVRGAQAATLLACGCPLDLDLRAFPVGMCTRTMLGKAEVIVWRTGPAEFRLEVWRSFAAYVCALLADGALGI